MGEILVVFLVLFIVLVVIWLFAKSPKEKPDDSISHEFEFEISEHENYWREDRYREN